MAALSLIQAAEQVATSKVDVWRAIREGVLPARKMSDGEYAIDQTDLFRVFARKPPEPRLTPPEPPTAEEAPVAKTEASESPATDDLSIAFAALQAELQSLLGPRRDVPPPGVGRRTGEVEERSGNPG